MAKFANHELANEAASTGPEPPIGSSAVSVPFGDELFDDFKLHKRKNQCRINVISHRQSI